jgi:hypothetical protein
LDEGSIGGISLVVPGPPYPGVYEHYKGDFYVVHKVITDSTNDRSGRIVVLYESLEKKELHVRDVIEFLEDVHEDGQPAYMHHIKIGGVINDCCKPRFRLLNLA